MKNRTVRGITALTLGAALLLSACGSDSSDPEESASASASATVEAPDPADVALLDAVTWTGEPGTKPVLSFTAPLEVSREVSRVVTEGTGADAAEDGTVWFRSVTYDGRTGEEFTEFAGSWDRPESLDLNDAPEGHPLLVALGDKKVGTQSLYATPLDLGDGTSATAVTAIEVIETPDPITLEQGMPSVTFDESGAPSIEIQPGFAGPEELITQVLTEGDGPVVESGQTVSVNYTGWLQSTGEKFDSSWDRGTPLETAIGSGAVIDGWDQGLVGQKVGSTVLLVIPSDLAYGDKGQGNIPGGASLIFVVEILSAS